MSSVRQDGLAKQGGDAFLHFFLLRELAQKLLYKKVDLLNLEAELLVGKHSVTLMVLWPSSFQLRGRRRKIEILKETLTSGLILIILSSLLSHTLGQCGAFAYPESMSWAGERCVLG